MPHVLGRNVHSDIPALLPRTSEQHDLQGEIEGGSISPLSGGSEHFGARHLSNLDRRFSSLAEEVRRLTSVMDPQGVKRGAEADHASGGIEKFSITADQVKSIIKARRGRDEYFRGDLFADPAWDILLDLTRAELECQRTSVTSLCHAASVPATTALRWIKTLMDEGILVRRTDPLDGRRIFVELTDLASESMQQYLRRFVDRAVAQVGI